jgi:peptidoglycan/xylan/chitin deacetylase (PgdA/CDA1 family)
MRPAVYISFDVECSMGGAWQNPERRPVPPARAVWGEYGERKLGLPLIVQSLDAYDVKGTFFVDAFMSEQGFPEDGETICRYLVDRGHDVQLHIHPNHKHYGLKQEGKPFPFTDSMADPEPAWARAMIEEGRDRITRWIGRAPSAFRAGNMAVNGGVLEQLDAAGIGVDSSYTFPYAGTRCRLPDGEAYNGSKRYGRVLELALSGFTLPAFPGLASAKPLDLVGISFAECRDAIRAICGAGADAVVILHSFSLFKVKNTRYDGGRLNRIVARRFRKLCRWLADKKEEYPMRTFDELAGAVARGEYVPKAVPPCRLSAGRALVRKTVQAVNRLYRV